MLLKLVLALCRLKHYANSCKQFDTIKENQESIESRARLPEHKNGFIKVEKSIRSSKRYLKVVFDS